MRNLRVFYPIRHFIFYFIRFRFIRFRSFPRKYKLRR